MLMDQFDQCTWTGRGVVQRLLRLTTYPGPGLSIRNQFRPKAVHRSGTENQLDLKNPIPLMNVTWGSHPTYPRRRRE